MIRTALIAFVAGAALACAIAPSVAQNTAASVTIDNFVFEPGKLTIKAGTTVTWTNRDDIPHAIVSAGKFRSKALDTDNSFSFTFTAAGDYPYFCSLHPHMTGTIKVE